MSYNSAKKDTLLSEILSFQKIRNFLILPLVFVGLAGIIIPVLPGIAILFAGILLWKPELAEKIREKAKAFYENLVR